MSACSRCNAGPSDAAREKAILKRQRKAGLVLAGRAAKNKRRSELVARGVTDADILDEMTTSVGLSGVPFVVDVASRKGKLPTSTLPVGYELRQVIGEQEACDALLRYHSSTDRPDSDFRQCPDSAPSLRQLRQYRQYRGGV